MLLRDESDVVSEFTDFTTLLQKVKLQESSKHYQPAGCTTRHLTDTKYCTAYRDSDIIV